MLSLNINLLSVHCAQSTQRDALHISFQAIYLRAVAERDERHVACKGQSCWLFRDAHFLPRISGLTVRARPYAWTASGSRLCRFSHFYSRAQRWNGRFHEGLFMLVPEDSLKKINLCKSAS